MAHTDDKLDRIWDNAAKVRGKKPNLYRKDPEGRIMYKASYGRMSEKGWEVDHKRPRSKGGSDNIRNLVARHWKSNRAKADRY